MAPKLTSNGVGRRSASGDGNGRPVARATTGGRDIRLFEAADLGSDDRVARLGRLPGPDRGSSRSSGDPAVGSVAVAAAELLAGAHERLDGVQPELPARAVGRADLSRCRSPRRSRSLGSGDAREFRARDPAAQGAVRPRADRARGRGRELALPSDLDDRSRQPRPARRSPSACSPRRSLGYFDQHLDRRATTTGCRPTAADHGPSSARCTPACSASSCSATWASRCSRSSSCQSFFADRAAWRSSCSSPRLAFARQMFQRTHSLQEATNELAVKQQENEFQALHDALTGMPNRTLFQRTLAGGDRGGARAPEGRLAVMLMDLDHFKEINDTLGSPLRRPAPQGDRSRASRRRSATRTCWRGSAATSSGLLLPDLPNEDIAIRVAGRLLEELEQPITVEGLALDVVGLDRHRAVPDAGRRRRHAAAPRRRRDVRGEGVRRWATSSTTTRSTATTRSG